MSGVAWMALRMESLTPGRGELQCVGLGEEAGASSGAGKCVVGIDRAGGFDSSDLAAVVSL
jgi:hypothetical protein